MKTTTSGTPRVTICLPTIGRLAYISETLDSIRSQTIGDYELLVLYNGSDPAVRDNLENQVRSHPGGRVLSDAAKMPMFANFNRGLREARGEYVAFFHDDDVYEPNFLERSTKMLDAHPTAAFVGSNYLIINSASAVQGRRTLISETMIQTGHEFISTLVRRGRGAIPTPGIVFRKNAFPPEGWDEKLSMHFGDFVVLMRIAETHDVALISDPLLRLRLHGKNASSVPMSIAGPMQLGAILSYIDEFAKRWPALPDMARSLRRFARASFIRYLTWGWIAAENDEEADRCLRLLREEGAIARGAALGLLSAAGLRASRRKFLERAVRRIGRSMG